MKRLSGILLSFFTFVATHSSADSVNSPNITLNVDTNRATGPGAGNVSLTVNTITIAETTLPEYSSGTGKKLTIQARPGFQFDPTSNITAQSTTIGLNNFGVNVVATVTPSGASDEVITFNLTSGTSSTVQDIIRVNGVKVRILDAKGAAGPAQTTLSLTSSAMGGAFTAQGIVAANITKGAPDHLAFSKQPGDTQAGADLLPEVKIEDFGNNVLTTVNAGITLSLTTDSPSSNLLGTKTIQTLNGVATWVDANDLNITAAGTGYKLQATHNSLTSFLTANTVTSNAFAITAGAPGSIDITQQPVNTNAGSALLVSARLLDGFGNPTTTNGVPISVDAAVNPNGWPIVVNSSLTKNTVNGAVTWDATDKLTIFKATSGYKLSLSGLGSPVLTNAFDILVGPASIVTFEQQPSNVVVNQPMSPPVTIKVTDAFNNNIADGGLVQVVLDPSCPGSVSVSAGSTVNGIATFSDITPVAACSSAKLLAVGPATLFFSSEPFRISAQDETPIGIKSTELKKGKSFKFNSTGNFTLPKAKLDDPTKNGATLLVKGTTGQVKFNLGKNGWKKNGNNGFKFQGGNCQTVLVTKNAINANCQGKTGSIKLPETEVDIVLSLGKGTKKFCGQCGGKVNGKPGQVFNRTNCSKPDTCP